MNFKLTPKTIYLFKNPLLWNCQLCNNIQHSLKISVYDLSIYTFKYENIRQYSNLPNEKSSPKLQISNEKTVEDWGDVLGRWYKKYQDFVGISEILAAQDRVTLLTNQLLDVQSKRRQLQRDVESAHQELLSTHQRITKSELYSEDHYCLFEKARVLSTNLKSLQTQFTQTEEEERNLFSQLSTAIKHCHERERTQSEQSKYWSILISAISASVAALITSINNWVRIKEIKDHASNLHKDSIHKAEQLHSVISSLSKENVSNPDIIPINNYPPPETLQQMIQSVVHDEVVDLVKTLTEMSNNNDFQIPKQFPTGDSSSHSVQASGSVSYAKVAKAMITGGVIGTIIMAIFWGAAGVGS